MKQFLFVIFLILSVFFAVSPLFAQVVINEFLIEPAPQSVELFNAGSESADISGWYLDDSSGSTYVTIPQGTILYSNSCAVVTGDFNFNKSSADIVRLFNNVAVPTTASAQLIDSFSYKSSSGSGVSYFRLPDGTGNWTTGSATPEKFNVTDQSCLVTPTPTPSIIEGLTQTPIPTEEPPPSPTTAPVSYDNIYISEAYVYPQTGEKEWIELYNDNEFSVTLTDWFIDDTEGAGSSPKSFTADIAAKGYAVFELFSSMFNNDGDSVRLLDFAKTLKDSFEYDTAEKGKSWSRQGFDTDLFCQTDPARGIKNNDCPQPTESPTPTPARNLAVNPPPSRKIPISNHQIPNKFQISKNQFPISHTRVEEEVLGAATASHGPDRSLPLSLSLASLLESLLTITSVLLRMKK